MRFGRFSLQTKILIILASTVVLVVGISTYIAMWLTQEPVEREIYRKALAQARLTAHNLSDKATLQNSKAIVSIMKSFERFLFSFGLSKFANFEQPRLFNMLDALMMRMW